MSLVMLSEGRVVATGSGRSVLTEAAIREHYGASVRVMEDADGRILVLPTRAPPEAAEPEVVEGRDPMSRTGF
jgi:iron complex transport system ATP-binding protein